MTTPSRVPLSVVKSEPSAFGSSRGGHGYQRVAHGVSSNAQQNLGPSGARSERSTAPRMKAIRPGLSELETTGHEDFMSDEDDVPTGRCAVVGAALGITALHRDRAALVRLDGSTAGQPMFIGDDIVRVGRHREAELRVDDDDGISRFHATIALEPEGYVLTDLNSQNGTLVQGAIATRRVLRDGDVIHFGPRTTFRFTMMDDHQAELMSQLYDSSTRDPLTGGYNRQHFNERLKSEIAYAVRHRSELSLVFFDLDHFKKINDNHGHPAGDAVLKYVAAVVTSRLRTEDVFARYGGEEFVVILRGTNIAGAARAAERLRGAVAGSTASIQGILLPVTISAGCAAMSCCGEPTPEALVATADRRLYAAKVAGRNRVVAGD